MDIKLDASWAQVAGSTFPVFVRGPRPGSQYNETTFSINTGGATGAGWWQTNGVFFNNDLTTGDDPYGNVPAEVVTPGDPNFKRITVVCDGIKLKIYANGALAVNTLEGYFYANVPRKWTRTLPFKWGGLVGDSTPGTGKVSIKNFYWWNRNLTSSEISTLNTGLPTNRYDYLGDGGCIKDYVQVAKLARTVTGCNWIGQMPNGCWHLLRKNNASGVKTPADYPVYLADVAQISTTYHYVADGPCTNDLAAVTNALNSNPAALNAGQQANGCWHLLSSGGELPMSNYTRFLATASASGTPGSTTSPYMPEPFGGSSYSSY